ncbi:toxin-antitoxin system YwqK family antitoxin [Neolewinella agarilytica]|uniref:toxin-antitoxin system YwqK family antitoxin n=1 Tax=Neolewinella agarilytica TaxID=478744 RepID=UPI0023544F57|nr:hypothetical protein [Neolewinella agarilytica]
MTSFCRILQMNALYPLLALSLLMTGCHPAPVSTAVINKELLTHASTEGITLYKGEPFSGTAVEEYADGTPAVAIDYVKGKREGYYRKWFADGSLSFESQYLAGRQHGETRSWWKNGNLRTHNRMEKGIANGLQEQWYKSGAKFKAMQLVNGQEEGLQQSWRENGKLYNNYEARDGRIFGLKRANLCFSLENEDLVYVE